MVCQKFVCWAGLVAVTGAFAGPFGGRETGRVALTTAPFVYKAKLDNPGFVRLEAYVVDKGGKRCRKQFTGYVPPAYEGRDFIRTDDRK